LEVHTASVFWVGVKELWKGESQVGTMGETRASFLNFVTSALNMEEAFFSGTLITFCRITCHNSQEHNVNSFKSGLRDPSVTSIRTGSQEFT
jgi:hypothetical protein